MYVGRFAPTTSGPLHLGSLLAAVASFLDARAHDGQWLLRFDDIDTPRSHPDAEQIALDTLHTHGMHADGAISRQTQNRSQYAKAIQVLQERDLTFYCTCSRKKLRGTTSYPGFCRKVTEKPEEPAAIRLRVDNASCKFEDRVQGWVEASLESQGGDFIVMRKEDIPAYPLAVIVDDDVTGVTDVVRGADLLENTLAQIHLINALGLSMPRYAHMPVLNQRDDIKLSKRDQAVAIDNRVPALNLTSTLHMLGMNPPPWKKVDDLINWGIDHWDINNVPKQRAIADFISV